MRPAKRSVFWLAGLLIGLGAISGGREAAAAPEGIRASPGGGPALSKGVQRLSLQVGYGEGFGAFSSVGKDSADVRTIAVASSWGIVISDPIAVESWARGSWEVLLEGLLTIQRAPRDGLGGGASLTFRYDFLSTGRFVPFVGLGAGIAGADFDLESVSDGFNFILQAGVGGHWLLSERAALTLEGRWHHYSNGGLRTPNSGIDSALFLIGTTVFFD